MYFQFQPELVLVSAGYDSAIGCPEVLLLHLDFAKVCVRVCVCVCVCVYVCNQGVRMQLFMCVRACVCVHAWRV